MATVTELKTFGDAVASALRARGFNVEIFNDVGAATASPVPSGWPTWLMLPNVVLVVTYPGVYAYPGGLKYAIGSYTLALPRSSVAEQADMIAWQFGSTVPTGGGPAIVIPDADLEPKSKAGQSVVSDSSAQVHTTAGAETGDTQEGSPGSQTLSVRDAVLARARASGHTGTLNWYEWSYYHNEVTSKYPAQPAGFGAGQLTFDQFWAAAYPSGGAGATRMTEPSADTGPVVVPPNVIDQLVQLVRQMLAVLLAAKKG